MKDRKQKTVSSWGVIKAFLCVCALFAATVGLPAVGESPGGPAALTVNDLRARRESLREEELRRRAKEEKRRWAEARQKGVVFVKTIKKSGELDKRIDVVMFADGFQKKEVKKFSRDASRVALQLLQTYPYSDYKNFFNFHIIGVASRDSGVSTGTKPKNTAFASSLRERNMLVADLSRLKFYSDLAPDMDLGIVVVNTTMREARSTAAGPYVTLRLGGSIGRTVAHELGHAFGGLADEYVEFKGADPNRSEPSRVNVTAESDPNKVKWHYWIKATKGVVNLYEGANLFKRGYYRPERQCLMRTGRKFCRVCLEQMIRRMYESVPPIDAAYPMEYAVEMTKGEKRRFAVRVNKTGTSPVLLEWYVDGVLEHKGAEVFTFNASRFKAGKHEVMVKATCRNRHVIRDWGLLESSMFWKVKVLPYSVPVLDVTAQPLRARVGEAFSYQVKGKPGSGGKALAYKTTLAPDGLKIDAKTGEITWTPGKAQAGAQIVTLTADDGSHSASADLIIAVREGNAPLNRPPVIEYIPIQDAVEGELIEFQAKANDLDGHHVVYDLKEMPDGASFDRHTGRFRWRPDFSQVGRYELEFEAWDGIASDRYKVPVRVRDILFGASDLAAAEREMARGNEDAFFSVFYALRCKNTSVKRHGITMLKAEGAKSSVVELNRLLRDRDESVAMAAADALLGIVKDRLEKDDEKYFFLLLSEISRTCRQLEDHADRLEKLKEIMAAIARKSASRKAAAAAEDLADRLERLSSRSPRP